MEEIQIQNPPQIQIQNPPQEHVHAHNLAGKNRAERSREYKGIRLRKWGSWVSEIRLPRSRQKLWLGSYKTAEQAARAYDVAVCCLRGPNARLNFPNSVPSIPSASSLSRHEIQLAAARHATSLEHIPSISPSAPYNNNENGNVINNIAREYSASTSLSASVQETVSLMNGQHHQEQEQEHELALWESQPSLSASVQETVWLMNGQHQQEQEQEHELALWESQFAGSDDCSVTKSLESLPSIDEASALNFLPSTSLEQQHHEQFVEEDIDYFLDLTNLWNFGGDV